MKVTSVINSISNPFIHGTNSFLLPMLKRTNFTILPVLKMLEQYGMAPMGGEVDGAPFGGGLDCLNPGQYICFGRLRATGKNDYDLKRITGSYTRYSLPTAERSLLKVKEHADTAIAFSFEYINNLFVHFARAKQLGVVNPLSKEQYEKLVRELKSVIRVYYLFMLLGKHIHPNVKLYKQVRSRLEDGVVDSEEMKTKYKETVEDLKKLRLNIKYSYDQFIEGEKETAGLDISDAIITHLSFDALVKKMMDSNLDIEDIYKYPTPEKLLQALSILEFPSDSMIMSGGLRDTAKPITFSETQFFTLKSDYPSSSQDTYKEEDLVRYSMNQRSYKISELFVNFIRGNIVPSSFLQFETILMHRISSLKGKLALLESLQAINTEAVRFTEEEMELMKKPFPIVLLSNAAEKISLRESVDNEYRAHMSLKIGEDITMIATDTHEHRLLVKGFLEEYGMHNVQVELINQLSNQRERIYSSQSGNASPVFVTAVQPIEEEQVSDTATLHHNASPSSCN